jgi:hypothetical protein
MTEVCLSATLSPLTLHLSVAILDARFARQPPPKSKYQLSACSSLLLAGSWFLKIFPLFPLLRINEAKFHENTNTNTLDVSSLYRFTDGFCPIHEILADELHTLEILNYSINIVTAYHFLSLFVGVSTFQKEESFGGIVIIMEAVVISMRKKIVKQAELFASMTLHGLSSI